MIRAIAATALFAGLVASPATAVTYSFSTYEPFVGGTIAFTYDAPDFITSAQWVSASLFTAKTPGLTRVRFDPTCVLAGGNCAQLSAVVGFTQAYRNFAAGAFAAPGTYSQLSGTAATLTVTAAAAVPEPSTWTMLIIGFGLIGHSARWRRARAIMTA